MANKVKYEEIYNALRNDLQQLPDNTKLPPFTELCKRYGISQATLCSALELLEQDGLVKRIRKVGCFSVKNPVPKKPIKFTLLMPGEQDTLFVAFITACSHFCNQHRIQLQFEFSGLDAELEYKALESVLADDECDGLLYMPLYPTFPREKVMNSARLLNKIAQKKPVVQFDRQLPGELSDFIGYDNFQAYCELLTHLKELGHKKIGLICSESDIAGEPPPRVRDFLNAMDVLDLELSPAHRITYDVFSANHSANAMEILKSPDCPTAFVGVNAVFIRQFLQTAEAAGKRIPEDISLCCYDLNTTLNLYPLKPTYYNEPAREVIVKAAQLLLNQVTGKRSPRSAIRLPGTLVIGDTTAACPKKRKNSTENPKR